jgi:hypothetical protein
MLVDDRQSIGRLPLGATAAAFSRYWCFGRSNGIRQNPAAASAQSMRLS